MFMVPHQDVSMAFLAYADLYFNLPSVYKARQFRVVSYKKHAVNVIVDWLSDGYEQEAEDILLQFIFWARDAYESNKLEMYKVAYETGMELYDYFYTDWSDY